MSLQEEMERLRNEIKETAGDGDDKEPEKVEIEEAQTEGDSGNEEEETEKEVLDKPEESKAEPKTEDKPDNNAFARLRWEAAEERRKREDLENRLKAIEAAKDKPKEAEDPEPDKALDFELWVEWKDRQLEKKAAALDGKVTEIDTWRQTREKQEQEKEALQAAISEFTAYENEFKAKAPDYDNVSKFYIQKLTESMKLLNPGVSDQHIGQMVFRKLLHTAGTYATQGKHPVESMYKDALAMGYVAPEAEKKTPAQPNLKAIDQNKRKSASGAATGGKGSMALVGLSDLSDMTMAQFSKLSKEDRARLKQEANGA